MQSAAISAHLGKEIAYAARADTHEHLDEVGAADGVKGARLVRLVRLVRWQSVVISGNHLME
jgi:hypothetical protein